MLERLFPVIPILVVSIINWLLYRELQRAQERFDRMAMRASKDFAEVEALQNALGVELYKITLDLRASAEDPMNGPNINTERILVISATLKDVALSINPEIEKDLVVSFLNKRVGTA